MLSLRARIFILISLVVLFILGISLLLVLRGKNNQSPAGETSGVGTGAGPAKVIDSQNFSPGALGGQQPVSALNSGVTAGAAVKPISTLEAQQNGVKQLARIFIERYNSYSTDSNYQNIKDVQGLVTNDLWKKLSSKIGTANNSSEFLGVTTESLNGTLSQWSDTAAKVAVQTRVFEDKNGVASQYFRDVDVNLVKVGDQWLVEKFVWGEKR